LNVSADEIRLADRKAWSADDRSVTLADIALESLHHSNQHQIMRVASYMSPEIAAPFCRAVQPK